MAMDTGQVTGESDIYLEDIDTGCMETIAAGYRFGHRVKRIVFSRGLSGDIE
jgi:hypothetical protein